jgi:hypothetical protein
MELWTKQRRDKLVDEIAGLRGDIKALKREREDDDLGGPDEACTEVSAGLAPRAGRRSLPARVCHLDPWPGSRG